MVYEAMPRKETGLVVIASQLVVLQSELTSIAAAMNDEC